jgi:hypothetical protein
MMSHLFLTNERKLKSTGTILFYFSVDGLSLNFDIYLLFSRNVIYQKREENQNQQTSSESATKVNQRKTILARFATRPYPLLGCKGQGKIGQG